MQFTLFNASFNLESSPELIKEIHSFWLDVYDRSPIMANLLLMMIPCILCYFIYTLGTIFKKESSIDKELLAELTAARASGRRKKK